jgi:glycosyltransferase involved in cell wall biosynthesis
LKILLATDAAFPDVNGVSRFVSQLQRYSVPLDCVLELVSHHEFPSIRYPGYPEVRVAILSRNKIIQRIERMKPDWVHITTEGPVGFATRAACMKLGLNFSTSFLTDFELYAALRLKYCDVLVREYLKRFHAQSSLVIVPAQSALKKLADLQISHGTVVAPGVDLELFSPNHQKYAPFSTLRPPIFLYVGRLAVEKNLDAFLSLELPGTKVIVGDGPARDRLTKKYPSALFLGYRFGIELAQIYTTSSVFVFPSRSDTFGTVQLEALASGLPVAAFPVNGPLDIVGSSSAGVLSEDLQSAALQALDVSKIDCRFRAEQFSEFNSSRSFFEELGLTKNLCARSGHPYPDPHNLRCTSSANRLG